jgi:D-glycero-D-manno-heptose 1,7-bisphosphate phosphatase
MIIRVHRVLKCLLWLSAVTTFTSSSFPPVTVSLFLFTPKLVLLDRDGVVNEDVGAPGVISIAQFKLTENAATAIGRLRRQTGGGCKIALVTNQSSVGKALISEQDLNDIHSHMTRLLLAEDPDAIIDRIYTCTSTDVNHPCRKPAPGMLLQAMHDFGVDDASHCVLVGDTVTDLQAAAAADISFRILVSTGYGTAIMGAPPYTSATSSIPVQAELITSKEPPPPPPARDTRIVAWSLPECILPFHYVKNLAAAVDLILAS